MSTADSWRKLNNKPHSKIKKKGRKEGEGALFAASSCLEKRAPLFTWWNLHNRRRRIENAYILIVLCSDQKCMNEVLQLRNWLAWSMCSTLSASLYVCAYGTLCHVGGMIMDAVMMLSGCHDAKLLMGEEKEMFFLIRAERASHTDYHTCTVRVCDVGTSQMCSKYNYIVRAVQYVQYREVERASWASNSRRPPILLRMQRYHHRRRYHVWLTRVDHINWASKGKEREKKTTCGDPTPIFQPCAIFLSLVFPYLYSFASASFRFFSFKEFSIVLGISEFVIVLTASQSSLSNSTIKYSKVKNLVSLSCLYY